MNLEERIRVFPFLNEKPDGYYGLTRNTYVTVCSKSDKPLETKEDIFDFLKGKNIEEIWGWEQNTVILLELRIWVNDIIDCCFSDEIRVKDGDKR